MVHIVDSIMGSGKTQAAINFINASDDDTKFLYITPYLTEVERIERCCSKKKFKQPKVFGSKMKGIKYLFETGENIVTTHALFSKFDEDILEICKSLGYILIMDEVSTVAVPYKELDSCMNQQDVEILLENYVTVDDRGIVNWREDQQDYSNGKYSDVKNLCNLQSMAMYDKNEILIWLFPVKIFNAFSESYVLTYMFDGQIQKYYYDFYELKYDYVYVKGDSLDSYEFTTEPQKHNYNYGKLINICHNDKLNQIGEMPNSLGYGWSNKYHTRPKHALAERLSANMSNYFKNICKAKAKDCIWTTYRPLKEDVMCKGHAHDFVTHNMKATNDYRDRHNVAYMVNRFFNPSIKNFFNAFNIKTDENAFATSEMLQFIWRSAIRQGESINIYIPSKRMRKLLEDWIAVN